MTPRENSRSRRPAEHRRPRAGSPALDHAELHLHANRGLASLRQGIYPPNCFTVREPGGSVGARVPGETGFPGRPPGL